MSFRSLVKTGSLFTALFFSINAFSDGPVGCWGTGDSGNRADEEACHGTGQSKVDAGGSNARYVAYTCIGPSNRYLSLFDTLPNPCPGGVPPESLCPDGQTWFKPQGSVNGYCIPNGTEDEQDGNGDGWPDGSDKDKDSDPDQDEVPNETDDDDDGDGIPDGEDENPFSTPIYTEGVDPNSYVPYQQGDLFVDEEGNVWEVTQDEACIYGATTTCYTQAYDTGLNDPDATPGNARQPGTPGQGVTQETGSSTQTNNGVTTETETTQSVNPDGSRTTTTTVTETYADGSSSVTTTTETDYRNTMNNGGTRETSTTRDNFDTLGTHTGTDNLGSGTQHYSDVVDDEEKKSASGGTNCDREPNCSGDPILCAILRQQWLTRCKGSISEEMEEGYIDGKNTDLQNGIETALDDYETAMTEEINNQDESGYLDDITDTVADMFGFESISCQDFTLEFHGWSASGGCEQTQPVRTVLAWLLSVLTVWTIFNIARRPVH